MSFHRPIRLLVLRAPSAGRGRDLGEAPKDFYEAAAKDFLHPHGIAAEFFTLKITRVLDQLLSGGHFMLFRLSHHVVDFMMCAKAIWAGPRYDVILAWYRAGFYLAACKAILGLRRPRLALVIYRAFDPHERGVWAKAKRRAIRRIFRSIDRVFCVSSAQVETLAEQLGIPAERIRVIFMGIDSAFFSPETRPVPDGGRVTLLIPGDSDRDEREVLNATRGLLLDVIRVCRARWNAHLPSSNGAPRVHYYENVTFREIASLYARADVVVLPVRNRTHPAGLTCLLEAMASGSATLIARGLSTEDYVADGRTAVLYDPEEPGSFRAKLDWLLSDSARRRAIGDAARRSVEERFALAPCSQRLAREVLAIVASDRSDRDLAEGAPR